ncbi:SMR family transporter [Corynebacterium breve]|uniref:SMR family transporter n=1 Tax=Corynebacterium breve TaxID=3049799 RepID=A0ABY8VFY6_9CORY|nr:SMR family transporter [Corynebacterium breve]WIM68027.1 SMR family transporter [Corynebacterium breve]
MNWFILIGSGLFEGVWANALAKTEGFTKLWPSLVFLVALVISMGGLAWAMRSISAGTAYAVWAGVGAAAAVIIAIAMGEESVSVLKILFLVMIVAGIVGLQVVSN